MKKEMTHAGRSCFTALALLAALVLGLGGCARAPSPLAPGLRGSIGMPHRGVLTEGAELPRDAEGVRWLRGNDRHWAAPRFVAALERAATSVSREREGPPLVVGDLSVRHGGQLREHMSHRTGHDVDLLLYVTTLSGAPVQSPGFVRFDTDGLAWDEAHLRFLRFDVERTWLLVKALVEDEEARVQWIFLSRPLQGMIVEWARARGEPAETVLRAERVLLQPGPPAETHDDHLHVRTGCDVEEMAQGCEPNGPPRAWIAAANEREAAEITAREDDEDDAAIAVELSRALEPAAAETASEPGASAVRGLAP
jgi:penicillin-insensitive murein endopeptidase